MTDPYFDNNSNGTFLSKEVGMIPVQIGAHLGQEYNTVGMWYKLDKEILCIVFSVINGVHITTLNKYMESGHTTKIQLSSVNDENIITDVYLVTRCVAYDSVLYMAMLYTGYVRTMYYQNIADNYLAIENKVIGIDVPNITKQIYLNDLFYQKLQTILLHWNYVTSNKIDTTKHDEQEFAKELSNYKQGRQSDLIFLSLYMLYRSFQGKQEYLPWTYSVENDRWKKDYHVPSNNFKSDEDTNLSNKPFSIDYTGYRFLPNLIFWILAPFQLGVFDYARLMITLDNFNVFKHKNLYAYSLPRGYKIKDNAEYEKHIVSQIFYMTSDHIILYGVLQLLLQGYSDEKYLILSKLQNSVLELTQLKQSQDHIISYLKKCKDKGSYMFYSFYRTTGYILALEKNADILKMPVKYKSYSMKPYIISWEYLFTFILLPIETVDRIFGEDGAMLKMWRSLTEVLGVYESKTLIGFNAYNLTVDAPILTLMQSENRREKIDESFKPNNKVEYLRYIALMCVDKLLEYYKDMETLTLDHYDTLNIVRENRDSLINNQLIELDIRSHIWKFFYEKKLSPFQLIPRNLNV